MDNSYDKAYQLGIVDGIEKGKVEGLQAKAELIESINKRLELEKKWLTEMLLENNLYEVDIDNAFYAIKRMLEQIGA